MESKKTTLEAKLNQSDLSLDQINQWSSEIGELVNQIDQKTNRWMELADKF